MQLSLPIRRILVGAGVCAVSCLISYSSYVAAGWGTLDAAYMVIITIFGIGYGEVHPVDSPLLKLQTMSLIIVGCLSGLYFCGGFIQLITEGEINRALGAQKMNRGIKKMKDHAIICGFGRVGKMLADRLNKDNIGCVVIDNDPQRLEQAAQAGLTTVCGDASSDETLESAGISRARTLACVLPNDAVNVFITLTARDLNTELEIIARAESPSTERKLRRSGANHVVLPAAIGALRMAEIISNLPPVKVKRQFANAATLDLKRVAVANARELEERTLGDAQSLLAEIGQVVGLQNGQGDLVTELESTMRLKEDDILLLAK